jgi:hypothetical protein
MRTSTRERAIMQLFVGDSCSVATEQEVTRFLKRERLHDKLLSRDEIKSMFRSEFESIVRRSRRDSRD